MVSIIVGGSMFGIVGMFLGVPLFAVIYSLLRDFTEYREKKHTAEAALAGMSGQEPEDVPTEAENGKK